MAPAANPGAPPWLARALARYGQWQGRYDARTEAWFRDAWRRSGDAVDLLQYLQFRRECGRLPMPELISGLRDRVTALQGPVLHQAAERLLEAGGMPEDLEAGWFRGPRIRLEDFFGEVIALAVPIQPLCSEACPGICPHCGVDRAQTQCSCVDEKIESPFAVLAKLKDGGKQQQEEE